MVWTTHFISSLYILPDLFRGVLVVFQPIISIKKHKTVPDTSCLTLLWCHFTQCIRLKECSAEWSSRPNVLVCCVWLVFLWPVSQTCLSFGIWTGCDAGTTSDQQKSANRRHVSPQNVALYLGLKSKQRAWTFFFFFVSTDQHPHQSQLGIQSLQDYTVLSSVFFKQPS